MLKIASVYGGICIFILVFATLTNSEETKKPSTSIKRNVNFNIDSSLLNGIAFDRFTSLKSIPCERIMKIIEIGAPEGNESETTTSKSDFCKKHPTAKDCNKGKK